MLSSCERLDDLGDDIKVISNKTLYCFTSDTVRLAKLVKGGSRSKLVDLCSGSGVIPLLLARTAIPTMIGIEIQQALADLAQRSVVLNNLSDRISIICANLIGIEKVIGIGGFDIVTCNPPYYPLSSGVTRQSDSVAMARHELSCTLKDIVATAQKLLKFGGNFYMVHKCERMSEVLSELSNSGLEPKEIYLYQPTQNTTCDTFVVIAKKGGKTGLTVTSQLITDLPLPLQ